MASGESKPAGGFKVTDRRSFTDEAGAREEAPAAPPAAANAAGVTAEAPVAAFPPVDFHTFVLSLGSSALLHLGEIENPNDGVSQKDLPLAKHTIDILVMLEEKTKGNLSTAEERLMESLLYDLRLRYVEAMKS
ncbi:MAG TPA: DUF1844 domain-containing protein [Polyangia bacterium]|jgi:hypothetical protein|nr:DUF1844 domain-containing protein [Polyangia bacterium]